MGLYDPVCVVPAGDVCGEGAIWCAAEKAVYWTDINRFLIHRHDAASRATLTWLFDEPVVALSLTSEPGRLLVALGSKLIWWWPVNDERQDHGFVLPGTPAVRLNDGRADPFGNFWVGSMKNNVLPDGEPGEAGGTDGKLFRIAPDGTVTVWAEGIGISNTVCWSPDRSLFYTADTLADVIWSYRYDERDGSIRDRKVFFAGHGKGFPDGSAIDAEGYLWNCRFYGRSIVRIAPNGTVDRIIDMPVKNITTACFGGDDLKTLYVTSAAAERDKGDRLAGALWAIRTDVPGLPENAVRV